MIFSLLTLFVSPHLVILDYCTTITTSTAELILLLVLEVNMDQTAQKEEANNKSLKGSFHFNSLRQDPCGVVC